MVHRARDERLQIMLAHEELKAVDDFRFEFRLPSRAAAIRELLKRGLASEGGGPADSGSRSRDFGVLDSGQDSDSARGRD